eukprot:5780294-Amphidinium_carterae.1
MSATYCVSICHPIHGWISSIPQSLCLYDFATAKCLQTEFQQAAGGVGRWHCITVGDRCIAHCVLKVTSSP